MPRKMLEGMAREADRARMRKARQALKTARASKRELVARAQEVVTRARAVLRAWRPEARRVLEQEIRELREKARTWPPEQRQHLRAEVARRRAELGAMVLQVTGVRSAAQARVLEAKRALMQRRDEKKLERTWARDAAITWREKHMQSDSDVRANLSADELTVWEVVKARVHGSARMSRTESFHHWCHEHSAEVAEILARGLERELDALEREEKAARAQLAKGYKTRNKKKIWGWMIVSDRRGRAQAS